MTPIYTETYRGYDIAIYPDEYADSPNEWGDKNLFLVANHRQFFAEPPQPSTFESVVADYKKTHHVFGLEAYIHGGVWLALHGSSEAARFPDRRWDVSLLGAVFVSKAEARTKAKAKTLAKSLLETWNDYLSSNVYRFKVTKGSELIDAVSGYYGDFNAEHGALSEARAAVDDAIKAERKAHQARKKVEIRNRVPLEKRRAMTV